MCTCYILAFYYLISQWKLKTELIYSSTCIWLIYRTGDKNISFYELTLRLELLKHLLVNSQLESLATSQFKSFAHFLEYSTFLIDWEVAMGFPIIN